MREDEQFHARRGFLAEQQMARVLEREEFGESRGKAVLVGVLIVVPWCLRDAGVCRQVQKYLVEQLRWIRTEIGLQNIQC